MTAIDTLRAIAANPLPHMTARQTLEARLGYPLGPIATMPKDLRQALYLLALELQKVRK